MFNISTEGFFIVLKKEGEQSDAGSVDTQPRTQGLMFRAGARGMK